MITIPEEHPMMQFVLRFLVGYHLSDSDKRSRQAQAFASAIAERERGLAEALNLVLAELREVSEDSRTNNFDHAMKQLAPEIRQHIKVRMSAVYWDGNDYDPEYAAKVARQIV